MKNSAWSRGGADSTQIGGYGHEQDMDSGEALFGACEGISVL